MDQNNQQDVNSQEQEQKPMNGSAKNDIYNNNSHTANGQCQTEEEETKREKPVANGNGVHSPVQQDQNNHVAAASEDSALLPHLESIERLMKLPVVEATWNQGQDVYGKVKGNLRLLHANPVLFVRLEIINSTSRT